MISLYMRKILISFLSFHGEVYMLEQGSMKRIGEGGCHRGLASPAAGQNMATERPQEVLEQSLHGGGLHAFIQLKGAVYYILNIILF